LPAQETGYYVLGTVESVRNETITNDKNSFNNIILPLKF